MLSILRTVVSCVLLGLLAGCADQSFFSVYRVVLLAPFEGEYRHIGYNALYAALLGLPSDDLRYELLAVDDGGSINGALDRALAIQRDPSVIGVIALGPFSVHEAVQMQLKRPVVLAGGWSVRPVSSGSVQLASRAALRGVVLSDERVERYGALGVVFSSAALPPDNDYVKRYQALSEFAPQPNTYATLVTDAAAILIASHQQRVHLRQLATQGLNGIIRFDEDGYWIDAPLYRIEITADGYAVTRLN